MIGEKRTEQRVRDNTQKNKPYHGNKNRNHPRSDDVDSKRGLVFVNVCACVGFSRVLAHPQVLKGQQATRVQRHQHVASFHDVQSEGPGANNDSLRLHPQRQHHTVLILRQDR